jgi:hypothetical protein
LADHFQIPVVFIKKYLRDQYLGGQEAAIFFLDKTLKLYNYAFIKKLSRGGPFPPILKAQRKPWQGYLSGL